jgi:hypothetical protein
MEPGCGPWASRQAGQTIRGEDFLRALKQRLARPLKLTEPDARSAVGRGAGQFGAGRIPDGDWKMALQAAASPRRFQPQIQLACILSLFGPVQWVSRLSQPL